MIQMLAPTNTPTWAVFTDEDGNPEIKPVIMVGCVELPPTSAMPGGRNLAVGFAAVGGHINPCDSLPHFIDYCHSADPEPWREKCKKRRDEIVKRNREAKIVLPEVERDGMHGKVKLHA